MIDTSDILPSEYRDLPGDSLPDTCPLCDTALDWEHDASDPSTGFIGGWYADCLECQCRFERGESENDDLETSAPVETLDYFAACLREIWDWVNADVLEEMASAHAVAMARLATDLERRQAVAKAAQADAVVEREEVLA